MNVSQLKQSRFLKKEDIGSGVLVTIRDCTEEDVAMPGAGPEMRWALHFDELEKPLILNYTNGAMIQGITGSADSEGWIGHKIVLYTDSSVMMHGKVVGGIRVRAQKKPATNAQSQSRPRTAPQPVRVEEPDPARDDDNVPF